MAEHSSSSLTIRHMRPCRGHHHNMLCGSRKELRWILEADRPQPCGFLIPPGTLLHIQEQMHLALEQGGKLRARPRADCLDAFAAFADQDRLLTHPRDIYRRI